MSRKQKRIMTGLKTGLISAVGTAVAFFGVRQLVRWWQQREQEQEYSGSAQRRLVRREGEQGITVSEPRAVMEEAGPGYRPATQPIPATGVVEKEIRTAPQEVKEREHAQPAVADMVRPLVHYLLIFANMIEEIRTHRQESGDMATHQSLSAADRNRFFEGLDGVEGAIPDYGQGSLIGDSLQERMYRLTVKVRDAMKNMDYTDADMFRVNGEVRSEACQLLNEIGPERLIAGENFERAWRIYECGTE